MTIATANLDITTDTFGTWLVKTNTLSSHMSNHVVTVDLTTTGNNTTGNGFVIGVFGANTLTATTLRGGSVLTPNTLTISSNLSITNTVAISNSTTISGNLSVTLGSVFSNTIAVTGAATLSNNLSVGGNTAITGTFSANGAANLNSIVGITGAATLANTISVTGTATLSNTLTVTGLTTLNNGVNTTTANASVALNVGANVNLVTDRITVQRGTNSIYMVANSTNTEIKLGNTVISTNNVKADTATFGNVVVQGDFSVAATLVANGSLVPAINDTFFVGNSTFRFLNGYILNSFGNNATYTNTITVGTDVAVNTVALSPSSIVVGNTTVNATINSSSFSGTSNNSTNFAGQNQAYYTNATNISSGTLNTARLPATANVTTAINVGANVNLNVTTIAVGNSTVNVTAIATQVKVGNTTANVIIGNNSININGATVNATNFTGNANTATALATSRNFQITGDVVAANVGFTGAGDVSLSATLANTTVTPGVYTKVTVDSKGRVNTGSYISSGDVTSALGFTPANKDGDTVTGNTTFNANVVVAATGGLIVTAGAGISANGDFGTAGQVLHSNGTSIYWDTDDQGVTSVASGNGLSGGPITTTGTLSVLANNGITANATGVYVNANTGLVANATGVYVNANTGLVANATGVHVNSAYIGTLNAASADILSTGRNFSLTGDVTASAVSFNGSAAVALSTTLSNTGVAAGQYTKLTVDAKGRVTSGAYISSGDVTSALGYTPVNAAGATTFTNSLTLQSTGPSFVFADSDWGNRSIHHNNGNMGFVKSDGGWAAYTDNAGNFVAVGNVSAYSDIKLKINIVGIVDALNTVSKLRGVRYNRKETGKLEIGVIAQEVEQILPEVVSESTDGTKMVSYGNMVGLLIEAVKELNEKVKVLEKKLEERA